MNETYIKNVLEAAMLAAGRPLTLNELAQLFDENARPDEAGLRAALAALEADYSSRGIEVKEISSGFRIQVRKDLANEVSRLWPERPPRYSRALLETLALIAYRQPITRAEIEAVRGVAVNPNIIKTVIERNWVKVVGTRDVPGRPELLGTTTEFLDYFGLKGLDDLPPLAELKAMGDVNLQLDLAKPGEGGEGAPAAAVEGEQPASQEIASQDAAPAALEASSEAIAADDAATSDAQSEGAGDSAVEVEAPTPTQAIGPMEVESDSGDVTVEVEALTLVEARIEATLEQDEPAQAEEAAQAEPEQAAAPSDATLETGEFEMSELGVEAKEETPATAAVIEAEFEAEDLDEAVAESDDAEDADDEEELSASPRGVSKFVASPRDNDD